jgi:hypothetical protein
MLNLDDRSTFLSVQRPVSEPWSVTIRKNYIRGSYIRLLNTDFFPSFNLKKQSLEKEQSSPYYFLHEIIFDLKTSKPARSFPFPF